MTNKTDERQYKDPPHRRKYKAKSSKRLRDYYREHGICYHCGQRYAVAGHVLCYVCRQKKKLQDLKYDPDGSRCRENKRILRQYRRDNRLCVDCGKPLGDEMGYVRCPTCRRKGRERCQVYRIKKRLHSNDKKEGIK